MHIPVENLSLVVQYALQELDQNARMHEESNHKTALCLLSGFSLASQKYRQIALRELFRTYHVTRLSHLQGLDNFPAIYRWIRELHCPVNLALHATEQQFATFTYLRYVHLWGSAIGLSEVLQRLPKSVEEMTLPFDHANDHTSVLTAMSRFENMTSLRVTRSLFEVPPASDVVCADIPPHHYAYSCAAARLLKPLGNLRFLQIDHYLTDTDVIDFHASQCPWSSASSAFCATCWDRFGRQTAKAEISCTTIMAQGLRSLETVTWKSWFTVNAEGYSRLFITRVLDREGGEELQIGRERDAIESDWEKLLVKQSNKCYRRVA